MKNYSAAPLPFRGQKRQWLQQFDEALDTLKSDTIIDCFGGSGLLAHRAKQRHPDKRVIWNDFDDYQSRLNMIPQTRRILAVLRAMFADLKNNERVPEDLKQCALTMLEEEGACDYLTISASVLFSGNSGDSIDILRKQIWWSRIPLRDLPEPDGYLSGVERAKCDFADLAEQHPDAALICDPPYPTTDCTGYAAADAINVNERLLKLLISETNREFVYWANSRSLAAHAINLTRANCHWWLRENFNNYASRQTEYMVGWSRP